MEQINHTLFLMINAGPDPFPVLVGVAVFLAKGLVFVIPVLLVSLWLWGTSRSREVVIKAILAIVVGIVVVDLIRLFWPYPRPFVMGVGQAWLEHAPDPSFPSNHAVFCFSVALTFVWNGATRPGWGLFLVGILVSWARVFLGVHFPLDILGGLIVSSGIVMGIHLLFRVQRMGDRLVVLLENIHRRMLAGPIAKGWVSE